MTALPFAWRSLVRQPARSILGVLGVAAVGALLFDMLLLSEGLVVSMRDLFERMGFDIRIIATDQLPAGSPDIRNASMLAAKIAALPTVRSALTIRTEDADFATTAASTNDGSIVGIGEGAPPPWTVLRGRDLRGSHELVLNQHAAETLNVEPGAMGENITTRGLPILELAPGARLHIGEAAVVEITGLRNPCNQLDNVDERLLRQVAMKAEDGSIIRKAGIMGIVLEGGIVRPGDAITVEVRNGRDSTSRRIVTGDLPTVTAEKYTVLESLELVNVTPAIRSERNIRSEQGVLIFKLAAEVARATGLQEGDVILAINRTPVRTAAQVQELLNVRPGEVIRVYLERDGQITFTDLVFR